MKKVVKKPVVFSAVSNAVVSGVAAMFTGRRESQENEATQDNVTTTDSNISYSKEIYGDDNDLGYC